MYFTRSEKTVFIILAVTLFAGALILHKKHTSARHGITIVRDGLKQKITAPELEGILEETRKVSINSADIDRLTIIPGIGETLASRIINYREKNGPFRSYTGLLNVEGIGEKKLEKIRPFVKIEQERP